MDDRRIEWTGERCVPWTDDLQVIYEHYHRYALAARFTAGARVLDLACGEGFGAALLATGARDVVGVDIDPQTVEHACANYSSDKLHFRIGSMIDPELLAGADRFDIITCFEALEHVEEQDTLIAVVRRLLAPGGLFLTSTPDVTVYSHEHGNDNPFHVRELTEPELRTLLGGAFGHVAILRQNVAVGSLISGSAPSSPTVQSLRRALDGGWRVASQAPHTYLLGIASDAALPELPQISVLVDADLTIVRDAHRALARQRERTAELADQLQQAEAAHTTTARRRQRLEGDLRQLSSELAGARRRAQRAEAQAAWQREIAGEADGRAAELQAEVLALRAEQSATAARLISRYRGTVERAAPRGTLRRDLYERALGRRPTPAATPAAAPPLGPVALRTSTSPLLSIVVPVHGKWDYTRACLVSVEAHRPAAPFEVVVVDDASPDRTAELVAASPGVRLVRTEHNIGFIGACNLGANHARGSYLLFLNNETEVQPGALDALVDAADSDDQIGLVGAMLVYPDGRLQEAAASSGPTARAGIMGATATCTRQSFRCAGMSTTAPARPFWSAGNTSRPSAGSTSDTRPRTTKTPTWPSPSGRAGTGPSSSRARWWCIMRASRTGPTSPAESNASRRSTAPSSWTNGHRVWPSTCRPPMNSTCGWRVSVDRPATAAAWCSSPTTRYRCPTVTPGRCACTGCCWRWPSWVNGWCSSRATAPCCSPTPVISSGTGLP
jgi:hypothetical protein